MIFKEFYPFILLQFYLGPILTISVKGVRPYRPTTAFYLHILSIHHSTGKSNLPGRKLTLGSGPPCFSPHYTNRFVLLPPNSPPAIHYAAVTPILHCCHHLRQNLSLSAGHTRPWAPVSPFLCAPARRHSLNLPHFLTDTAALCIFKSLLHSVTSLRRRA